MPAAELGARLSRQPVQARRAGRRRRRELVVAATFRLAPADPDTIKARLDEIRRWRQAHQPLGLPSAGSVFRNPPGDSAGRLIDAAGLKGRRIGGAVVSEKHANFIVNDQKGTAADVRRLAEHVRAEVADAARRRARVRGRVRRRLVRLGRRRADDVRRGMRRPRRSPSCSAARRPSTTCRSCRGRRSPDALADAGHPGRARSSSTSTARWWWLPAGHRRDGRPGGRLRRSGGARRRRARSPPAPRWTGSRAARPAPGRVHRPPRPVRRGRDGPGACSRRPASPTRAPASPPRRSAWTRRSSSGSCRGPRAAGRRLARGPRRRAGRADPRRRPGRARGVRRRDRRPAADGQAGAPRAARSG